MHHIVLSIHPHIVEGSRSHGHDSDMIFDLQLGYGQFHDRLSLPTPLLYPSQTKRLGRSTRFLLRLPRPCPVVGAFGRSWLGYGHLHGWLLLRKPLRPSTAKNNLDRSFGQIFLFSCPPWFRMHPLAFLMFGRSSLGFMASSLAGCGAMTGRGGVRAPYLLHLRISAWLWQRLSQTAAGPPWRGGSYTHTRRPRHARETWPGPEMQNQPSWAI